MNLKFVYLRLGLLGLSQSQYIVLYSDRPSIHLLAYKRCNIILMNEIGQYFIASQRRNRGTWSIEHPRDSKTTPATGSEEPGAMESVTYPSEILTWNKV